MKRGLASSEETRASVRSRYIQRLNENFRAWVDKSTRERPLSDWSVGVWDYIQAAKAIQGSLSPPFGRVYSFGSGDCGQLGHGVERGDADLCVGRPRIIDSIKDEEIESVACGGLHTLSSRAKASYRGLLRRWLPRPFRRRKLAAIVPLPRSKVVIQVTAGDCHSVALTSMDTSMFGNVQR